MPDQPAPAVILAHGSGGLGALRALARRGVAVTAISFGSANLIMYSRLAEKKIVAHGDSDEEIERNILDTLQRLPDRGAVLMASSDRLVALISGHRDELLGKYRFVLPSPALLEALNDKRKETAMIESMGFDLPATVVDLPDDPLQLEKALRYPIIFKPHSFRAQTVFEKKNAVVADRGALLQFYERHVEAIPLLLAQEVITGPDTYSWVVSCTFDHQHEMLDCGIKQKIRCLPAHYGGSTYAVCRNNDTIMALARELGRKLEYVGHAGIEFRWDERDERYKYIEINPRIPANVGFDEGCGLATVWNSYRVSLGEPASHSGAAQREGTYYVDLTGDLASLKASGVSPIGIIREVLSLPFKQTHGLFFAWDDPLPGLVVGTRFVVRNVRRVMRRMLRRSST